jgi:hypothetical protein
VKRSRDDVLSDIEWERRAGTRDAISPWSATEKVWRLSKGECEWDVRYHKIGIAVPAVELNDEGRGQW